MTAARRSTPPVLPHGVECVLPNGKRLDAGREFSVRGKGRFAFRYVYEPDGSIAAFGPLTDEGRPKDRARVRSFRPEAVDVVHNRTVLKDS